MATKPNKQKQSTKDQADSRNFLLIVAAATVLLMLLMYFIFA
jgi:hypothetical protein